MAETAKKNLTTSTPYEESNRDYSLGTTHIHDITTDVVRDQ